MVLKINHIRQNLIIFEEHGYNIYYPDYVLPHNENYMLIICFLFDNSFIMLLFQLYTGCITKKCTYTNETPRTCVGFSIITTSSEAGQRQEIL